MQLRILLPVVPPRHDYTYVQNNQTDNWHQTYQRGAICMTPSFNTHTLYMQAVKTTVHGWVYVSREFRAVDCNIVSLIGLVP